MSLSIKMQNLERLHESILPELKSAFEESLKTSNFIQGKAVQSFEANFARFSSVPFCIGVANGTDALEIALECLEIKPGQKVFVPSMTFAATAECVIRQGGIPVFVEMEEQTYGMDPQALEKAIQENAGSSLFGVIAVHLYGQVCQIDQIHSICKKHGLKLIEDAAQAHGASARLNGKEVVVGSYGEYTTFSFFPGKNLGALGDAGALLTSHLELAERARLLRDHGRTEKYLHSKIGRNSRLDALQAKFLDVKLKYLKEWTEARRKIAEKYNQALAPLSTVLKTPKCDQWNRHVYHQYVVRVEASVRSELIAFLKEKGIEAAIHYPLGLHEQPAFAPWARQVQLPVSKKATTEVFSLPMDPLMTEAEVGRVVDVIKEFFGKRNT